MKEKDAVKSKRSTDATKQSKRWCITVFKNLDGVVDRITSSSQVSYFVLGREVCPDTKREHIQGYLEVSRKITLAGLKKLLGEDTCHCEFAKGTSADNTAYCTKDGKFTKGGLAMVQGARSDLGAWVQGLREGKQLAELAIADPETYCRYRNGLRDIAGFVGKRRTEPPRVVFLHGVAGSGKTRHVYDKHAGEPIWSYPGCGWFDGYVGQRIALFDDFCDDCNDGRVITYDQFLKILDRYPLTVPVKGGFTEWLPEIIYITSNRSLESLYSGTGAYLWEAVKRRFTERINFTL